MSGTGIVERMSSSPRNVRWLDEQEQADWRAYLDATSLLQEALNRDLVAAFDLTLDEYEIMVRLSENEGRKMRMSQLAGEVVHSRSWLTHTIKRMEKAGYVERAMCIEDRRGVECVLTNSGYSTLVKAAPVHVESVRKGLLDRMTPTQFHTLGRLMAKLAPGLRAES